MKRVVLLLTGLFLFFTSYNVIAQKETKYQGLLWEISGNGLKKPSYLYGTMHVSNKVAFHLSDTFFVALNNCDVVALELNPDKWLSEILESDVFSSMMGANASASSYDDGYLYDDFKVEAPTNKQLMKNISKDFGFANQMLYRFSGYTDNFEENTYLDLFIFQSGKKLKKEITGLENFRTVMEMTIEATIPDKEDISSKKYNYNALKGLDLRNLMDEAYRKGDLDMLDSLNKMGNSSEKYLSYMLYKRNIIMANNIDSIAKSNKSLFSGVGAAHLPGDKGVITLLRKKDIQ